MALCALGLVALSLAFWLGRWRARAELMAGVNVPTQIRTNTSARIDDAGNLRITFAYRATGHMGLTISAEDETVIAPAEWQAVVPK